MPVIYSNPKCLHSVWKMKNEKKTAGKLKKMQAKTVDPFCCRAINRQQGFELWPAATVVPPAISHLSICQSIQQSKSKWRI